MIGQLASDPLFIYLSGVLTFLCTFATVIWRVGAAKNALEEKIVSTEHTTDLELAKVRQEVLEAKLEAVNTFIHKDSFEAVMRNLDARLIRLESKLDRVLGNKDFNV